MLLKGASLKNTEWVVGVAVFTGHDSKIMMNSQEAIFKQSKVEKTLNLLVIYIVIAQMIISAILAIIGSVWYSNENN